MRIFYAADTTPNAFLNSSLWRNNLYLPLIDMGHEVIEFQYDLRETFHNLNPNDPKQKTFIERNKPLLTEALLEQVRAAHAYQPINLFFSYFYDACIFPEAVDEIREMGIKTVNWYCNGSYQLSLVSEISPHYDWCLVPEKFRLQDYVRLGANPIYCQEAANPNIYKPYNLPKEFDVTFVGQKYGDRPQYIRALLDSDIDAYAWGQGWNEIPLPLPHWRRLARTVKHILLGIKSSAEVPLSHCGNPLTDAEYIQMYSRSKISLGFTTVADLPKSGEQPIKQVRLRDFEAPMSGAFYMVEYFEELTEFFEPDKEVVYFHNSDELIDKARYYLAHDNEREQIRLAGMQRARSEHSWHQRFQAAFQQMDLI